MSSDETIIHLNNISKCFRVYDSPAQMAKQYLFMGMKKYYHEFWALRNINFEARRGDRIGVLGRNGAGKSTLLQIVSGIMTPTTGEVSVKGRVAALLELGSGFNPQFTGRENVYMCGAILGLNKKQIDERYDDILAFADIGEFVNQPVKTYSSGMMLRLAFAVNAHVNADILIVDEALAVGDLFFQNKCMARIRTLLDEGVCLLFVSHDTGTVRELCNKALFLNKGEQIEFGDSSRIASMYLRNVRRAQYEQSQNADSSHGVPWSQRTWVDDKDIEEETKHKYLCYNFGELSVAEPSPLLNSSVPFKSEEEFAGKNLGERYGSGRAKILGIDSLDAAGSMKSVFEFGEKIIFRCYIEVREEIQALCLNLRLDSKNGVPIAHISSYEHRYFFGVIPAGSKLVVDVSMTNYFGGGKLYSLHTGLTNLVATKNYTHEILDSTESSCVFKSEFDYAETPVHELVMVPFRMSHTIVKE